ncbi:MAG: recombinase family protein [Steroidobacteraceae bacterium]
MYARYSTQHQNESSIEDQIRACRKICDREGFKVVDTFPDAAISGGTARRPGYQALLAAARVGAFDVIVAESSSRLWRETAEQWRALKEWANKEIHVVCHGIDTRRPESNILLSVTGAANEAFRQEIGRRTREGQVGLAEKGYVAGGRTYGYRNVKRTVGGREMTERVIEPREAKIVRRIFKLRAEGHSPLAICRVLNADNIPSPGAAWARTSGIKPTWRASALIGDPRFGTGMLSNPLYRGRAVWGRMKWKRDAGDSSIRIPVPVPEKDWIVHEVPHLRIVDERLFDKVQALQAQDTPFKAAIRKGIRMSPNRGKGSYWLSGILVCDLCGSNLQASGSESYACPSHSMGKCANNLRFKRADAEAEMLKIVRDELLQPERLNDEMRRVATELKELERQERNAMRQSPDGSELQRIEAKIKSVRNLNLGTAAEYAAIRELDAEREALAARAAKKLTPGLKEARQMLAQLPTIAEMFDKRLEATLTGGKATRDEMRVISEATRELIVGGCIRMRPKGKTMAGSVDLLGLGEKALRVAGTTRRARVSGSGGRI